MALNWYHVVTRWPYSLRFHLNQLNKQHDMKQEEFLCHKPPVPNTLPSATQSTRAVILLGPNQQEVARPNTTFCGCTTLHRSCLMLQEYFYISLAPATLLDAPLLWSYLRPLALNWRKLMEHWGHVLKLDASQNRTQRMSWYALWFVCMIRLPKGTPHIGQVIGANKSTLHCHADLIYTLYILIYRYYIDTHIYI